MVAAIAAYEEKARPILEEIEGDLENEAPDADSFAWPTTSNFAAAEDEDPLYDSTRGYVEQIGRYKQHQDKPTEHVTFDLVCKYCKAPFTAKMPNAKFCSPRTSQRLGI